ncbi:MAG: AAA family ATPase [Alphaproteobacteria bacterium GM202ARS2]|nr:AAA family ATPase [Alphaproteobacteria bacterium GM202ARS2]
MNKVLESLREGLKEGLGGLAKRDLARTLSRLESPWFDDGAGETAALLDAAFHTQGGTIAGITGPPGAGKSTLIGALVRLWRKDKKTVAVIAVDPSSKISGGSLLGDRLRFDMDGLDEGTFVRSVAAGTRLGGVADSTYPMAVLLQALFDIVLIETVGVGQSETDIRDIADSVALCIQPGSGDSVQFIKAGIIEIPDMLVITKKDMPQARATVADVRSALALYESPPPVFSVAAHHKENDQDMQALADALIRPLSSRPARAKLDHWLEGFVHGLYGTRGTKAEDLQRLQAHSAPFTALCSWLCDKSL